MDLKIDKNLKDKKLEINNINLTFIKLNYFIE